MELTSLEKTYYDEFSKSFGKYGNGIPSEEWDRLSKVRKGLDITLKLKRNNRGSTKPCTYNRKRVCE